MEMGAGSEEKARFIIYYDTEDKIKDLQKIAVGKEKEISG